MGIGGVIEVERRSKDIEFGFKSWELEFGFVVELGGVEEDEEGERAGTWEGEDAGKKVVGEADGGGGGEGFEVGEFGKEVGCWGGGCWGGEG